MFAWSWKIIIQCFSLFRVTVSSKRATSWGPSLLHCIKVMYSSFFEMQLQVVWQVLVTLCLLWPTWDFNSEPSIIEPMSKIVRLFLGFVAVPHQCVLLKKMVVNTQHACLQQCYDFDVTNQIDKVGYRSSSSVFNFTLSSKARSQLPAPTAIQICLTSPCEKFHPNILSHQDCGNPGDDVGQ